MIFWFTSAEGCEETKQQIDQRTEVEEQIHSLGAIVIPEVRSLLRQADCEAVQSNLALSHCSFNPSLTFGERFQQVSLHSLVVSRSLAIAFRVKESIVTFLKRLLTLSVVILSGAWYVKKKVPEDFKIDGF